MLVYLDRVQVKFEGHRAKVVCRVLCAKVVGVTSREGLLVYLVTRYLHLSV